MQQREIFQIILGIIVLALVSAFEPILNLEFDAVLIALLFSAVIIITNILGKKVTASLLDSDVEHEIWQWQRFGFKPGHHLPRSVPAGVIAPIFITAITTGLVKFMTILTYETRALKRRAARRFGPFSYAEITDKHNAIIGAGGIIITLLVSFVSYWISGAEPLARLAAFYAFFNMLPFSKLDGTQIYAGSRVLWATLAIITLIFTGYALFLV